MGITVVLQNERGEEVGSSVGDPYDFLHRLLPPFDDSSYQCLRFIDWWGDTIFNRLQMETFLSELNRIDTPTLDAPAKALLQDIRRLGEECRNRTHLYLAFYGD
jgi:hypothetical protein